MLTVIDALEAPHPQAGNGAVWRVVTDGVMGGISRAVLARETVAGRPALRLRGEVRLENDGGFVQMALDLAPDGGPVDAAGFAGLELDVLGNGEGYGLHLRTTDLLRPWQSYRQGFAAPPAWTTVRLPFAGFTPHRTDVPLDLRRLRRVGLVAIGRAFAADLSLGRLAFYGPA